MSMDLTPIMRADRFNDAAPGANTDILAADITPSYGATLAIGVRLATASVFNLIETRDGVDVVIGMNLSVALQAGDGYTFLWPCSPESSYNFQVETNGVISILRVHEMPAGVA